MLLARLRDLIIHPYTDLSNLNISYLWCFSNKAPAYTLVAFNEFLSYLRSPPTKLFKDKKAHFLSEFVKEVEIWSSYLSFKYLEWCVAAVNLRVEKSSFGRKYQKNMHPFGYIRV